MAYKGASLVTNRTVVRPSPREVEGRLRGIGGESISDLATRLRAAVG